ncbi:MAG: hypothetical protein N4A40_09855 [Tissierellales bacterium]|nr:hypothetical protein [Tissierellales bacterium]
MINIDVFAVLFVPLLFIDLILTMYIIFHPFIYKKYTDFINWFKEENRKAKVRKKQFIEFQEYQKRIS